MLSVYSDESAGTDEKGDRAHRIFTERTALGKTKLRYEMSKESIAVVNQHYHDMKHQLMILSTMSDEDKRKAKLQDMESKLLLMMRWSEPEMNIWIPF